MRDEPATFALDIDDTIPTSPERMLWCAVILRAIWDLDSLEDEIKREREATRKAYWKDKGGEENRKIAHSISDPYEAVMQLVEWFISPQSNFPSICHFAFGDEWEWRLEYIRNYVKKKIADKNKNTQILT